MLANDLEGDPVMEAASWFAAQHGGELTPAERTAFLAWLKKSPAHIEEYLAVAAAELCLAAEAREATDAASELHASHPRIAQDNIIPFGPDDVVATPEFRPRPKRRARQCLLAVACTVLLTLVVSVYAFRDTLGIGFGDTYRTVHGQQGSWRLLDGSMLYLNTQSAATVRFRGNERLVTVHYGQARFGVAHDSARRFRVAAGNATIIAVGTEFEVYRTGEAVQVTTFAGRVAVLKGAAPAATVPTLDIRGAVPVNMGEHVVVDPTSISRPQSVDLESAGAWMQRRIVFERATLRQVIAEFNRYAAVPLQVADPELNALEISGAFSSYDPDSFIDFMRQVDGVAVEVHPDVVLFRRQPAGGR